MSNLYGVGPQQVRVSAGTAIKIGFFGALGVLLFSIVLSIILGIIALGLTAVGVGVFRNLNFG